MVSVKKKTQNTTRDLFQFVPIQNFKESSDIDWNKTIEEIDNQLFTKYKLDLFEVEFINSLIKAME